MLHLGCRATLHRACESSYWEYILLRIWSWLLSIINCTNFWANYPFKPDFDLLLFLYTQVNYIYLCTHYTHPYAHQKTTFHSILRVRNNGSASKSWIITRKWVWASQYQEHALINHCKDVEKNTITEFRGVAWVNLSSAFSLWKICPLHSGMGFLPPAECHL